MKKFLILCGLFTAPALSLAATEHRLLAIQRFGVPVSWSEKQEKFPQVFSSLAVQGNLVMARVQSIESIHPYDFDDGRPRSRPALIDDLVYESLLLPDPVGDSEKMYPLIARAVRVAADLSYVVFELDPRARFQDGTAVKGQDVVYSVGEYKKSHLSYRARFDAAVKAIQPADQEVRFDLNTKGQASRDAIMMLARIKIVKPNTTGAPRIGGLPVNYTATGPYVINQLGRSRINLIKSMYYWADRTPVRTGFFNFRSIELLAVADVTAARLVVLNGQANYYLETQPAAAGAFKTMLEKKKSPLELSEEKAPLATRPVNSLFLNWKRPVLADARIRRALLLAFDFDSANRIYAGNELTRPASLLSGSEIEPKGKPNPEVEKLLAQCELPPDDIEDHGYALYASNGDKRLRLEQAALLLSQAGITPGAKLPLTAVAADPNDIRLLQLLRSDLARLGVDLNVTKMNDNAALAQMMATGEYDIAPISEGFLSPEGWPRADLLNPQIAAHDCISKLAHKMREETPDSEGYRDAADALSRAHQMLALSIFTGQLEKNHYFMDARIQVPSGLSRERIYMYGYWLDQAEEDERQRSQVPTWFGSGDISDFFGGPGR